MARPAGACSHPGRGLDHRADHFRVLAHAQIVVGAPDHDFSWATRRMPDREWKSPRDPFELAEDPITPRVPQPHERGSEQVVIFPAGASFMPLPTAASPCSRAAG